MSIVIQVAAGKLWVDGTRHSVAAGSVTIAGSLVAFAGREM
ncbi:MAG TPA: hypothetical protein VFG50_15320 [Rhodothermales bacterium]|nr:hypothetical protein [Rhodothermales bacterium]